MAPSPVTPKKHTKPKLRKAALSPKKRKNAPLPIRIKQEKGPFLRVYGFGPEFSFEMYIIEKDSENDEYLKGISDYIESPPDTNSKHSLIDECNFYKKAYRRIPKSANEHLCGTKKGYWRSVILRYPKENESTPQTRQDGLNALSSFLKDSRFSKYPINNIITVDMTDEDNLPSLDTFLMDDDIKNVMEQDIDEEELNKEFVSKYPEFAKRIYAGNNYSDWARTLGFGN